MKKKKNKDEFAHYKQSTHIQRQQQKKLQKSSSINAMLLNGQKKEARISTCPLCQEVAYPNFWKFYSINYKNYSSAFVFFAPLTVYGSALTYELLYLTY